MATQFGFDDIDLSTSVPQPFFDYHPFDTCSYLGEINPAENGDDISSTTQSQYLRLSQPPLEDGNYLATSGVLGQTAPSATYLTSNIPFQSLFDQAPLLPQSSDNNSSMLFRQSFPDQVPFDQKSLSSSNNISQGTEAFSFSSSNDISQVSESFSPASDTSSHPSESTQVDRNSFSSTTDAYPSARRKHSSSSNSTSKSHNRTGSISQASKPTRLTHNSIEKRYRAKLNHQLDSLWKCIPPSPSHSTAASQSQPCKPQVIASARTYIMELRKENERMGHEIRSLQEKIKMYEELLGRRLKGRGN